MTFQRKLGEGAFATVDLYSIEAATTGSFKLRQRTSSTASSSGATLYVAVKKLRLHNLMPDHRGHLQSVPLQPRDRVAFQAEAILLRALRHPNVVACYGSVERSSPKGGGEVDGGVEAPSMIQEYCDGGTLLDKLRCQEVLDHGTIVERMRRAYTAAEALGWVHDVAKGMEYLHDHRRNGAALTVVHRDLKPENVLLSGGVAKVGDLGLSRMLTRGLTSEGGGSKEGSRHGSKEGSRHGFKEGSIWLGSKDASPRPNSREASVHGGAGASAHRRVSFATYSVEPSFALEPSPIPSRDTSKDGGASSKDGEGAPPPLFSAVSADDMTGRTGSCRYMAPEVWARWPYCHKVDIFSFAILAVEVLSRTRAYDEHAELSMEAIAAKVLKVGLRPALPRRWPAELASLIQRCWDACPEDRPEFSEVCVELELMKGEVHAALVARKGGRRIGTSSTSLSALGGGKEQMYGAAEPFRSTSSAAGTSVGGPGESTREAAENEEAAVRRGAELLRTLDPGGGCGGGGGCCVVS